MPHETMQYKPFWECRTDRDLLNALLDELEYINETETDGDRFAVQVMEAQQHARDALERLKSIS